MSAAQKDAIRASRRKKVEKGVEALVLVLKAMKSTSDAFSFPIGPIIDGLLKLCEVFQSMCHNEDAILELKGYVERLHETLFPQDGPDRQPVVLSDGLRRRLDALEKTLLEVSEEVTKIPSQSLLKRLTNASDAADKIQKCIRTLSWTLKNFLAGCSVDIYLGVEGLHDITRQGFRDVGEQIRDITQKVDQLNVTSYTSILCGLPYVVEARFDYHNIGHSLCDPDTRQEALSRVYSWLMQTGNNIQELEAVRSEHASARPLFWINGVAGTGKSTLAKTIAHWCHGGGILAATFFCSRDSGRSNVQSIIPTIAYQLALLFQPFMDCLASVMHLNPHVHAVYAWQQLQKLIIDPLRATRGRITFDQYAIIIDALDECNDDSAVSVILQALSMHVLDLYPLKFIITSRPDPRITAGFSLENISHSTLTLHLDDLPAELTSRDITRYLWNQLRRVREHFELPETWPNRNDVEALSEVSGQLFIFAATAIKFIADETVCDPPQQLSTLLDSSFTPYASSARDSPHSPYIRLDALYRQVLQSAFPGAISSQLTKVRLLLGTIVLAQESLSLQTYRALLNDTSGAIRILVQKLHSIVVRPTTELDTLRFVHLSFADFIVDSSRCTLPEYLVLPEVQHSVLARCCLSRMLDNLKYNLCAVEDESLLNSEIPDLRERLSRCIPPHVLYSCRYWSDHLCRCEIDEELFKLVLTFSNDCLLHWLSALSLAGAVDVAIEALTSALEALQSLPFEDSTAATLLHECAQVVRAFLPAIVASWSEVYRCTLSFLPETSALRLQYLPQHALVKTKLEMLRSLGKHWDLNTLTMDTRAERVPAVCFSPHGRWVVSADERGGVTIWGSQSGVQVRALEEPKIHWEYVIMSPDNERILAAGRFGAAVSNLGSEGAFVLQEWDAATGSCVTSWTTTYQQRPIVYSPDGKYRAATWQDGTIALWDATASATHNAFPLASLRQTETSTFPSGVAFSRDGTLLLSVSPGFAVLSVWDVQSRTLQRSIGGQYHKHSVGISHNDELIACGCEDATTTVEILNRRTMTCVRTLTNRGLWENTAILSLDFSPDDSLLVAISRHADVSLYNVDSGALLSYILSRQTLPASIQAIHFSPHDFRYVATGNDQYIRVRDVALQRPESRGVWKLASSVRSVWSRLQDTVLPGPRTQQLDELESLAANVFAFSPDGSFLATTRIGNVLRLWDVAAGTEVEISDRTTSTAQKWIWWSPSGRWLAMGFSPRISPANPRGVGGMMFWNARARVWRGPFFSESDETYTSGSFLYEYEGSNEKELVVLARDIYSKRSRLVTVRPKGKTLKTLQVVCEDVGGGPGAEDAMFVLSTDRSRAVIVACVSPGRHYLALLQVPSGRILQQSFWGETDPESHGNITALALSPDTANALLGTSRGKVLVWNIVDGNRDNRTPPTVLDTAEHNPVDHIWCSPTGQGFVTETGLTPLVAASDRASPGSGNPSTAYYLSDGWLWQVARDGCRRVGWIPPDFRHTRSGAGRRGMMTIGHGNVIALMREDGEVVVVRAKLRVPT